MHFDEILNHLGDFGPYQRRRFFLVWLMAVPVTWHVLLQVFTAGHSDHWCFATETDNINCSNWNLTKSECNDAIKDATIPVKSSGEYASCRRYNLTGTDFEFYPGVDPTRYSNTTISCDAGWMYDRSQYKSTIITQFNLVCDQSYFPDVAQSLFFTGAAFGSVLLGALADDFGRRPVLLLAVFSQFLLGSLVVISPNIISYVVFRTLQGVVNDTVLSLAFVIGAEFVGPKMRVAAGMMVNCSAAVGVMSLAIISAFARTWRGLQLFTSTPSLLLLLALKFVPESARWLFSIGRHDEAHAILKEAAAINNVVLPDGVFLIEESQDYRRDSIEDIIEEEEKEHQPSFKDLFRYPKLRSRTIILMGVAFTNSLLYFGLTLDTANWGERDYVIFFTSGVVELLAYLFSIYALDKFGRKWSEVGYLLLAGVGCIVAELVPSGWWTILIAMIGKFGASGSIATTPVYIIELMPTPVRSAGAGLGWMSLEIGSIAAPLTFIASSYLWEPLAFFLFGACALIACFFTMYLPETKGLRLLETLEEAENLGSTKSGASDKDTSPEIPSVSGETNDTGFHEVINQTYFSQTGDLDGTIQRNDGNAGSQRLNITSIENDASMAMAGVTNPIFQDDDEDCVDIEENNV